MGQINTNSNEDSSAPCAHTQIGIPPRACSPNWQIDFLHVTANKIDLSCILSEAGNTHVVRLGDHKDDKWGIRTGIWRGNTTVNKDAIPRRHPGEYSWIVSLYDLKFSNASPGTLPHGYPFITTNSSVSKDNVIYCGDKLNNAIWCIELKNEDDCYNDAHILTKFIDVCGRPHKFRDVKWVCADGHLLYVLDGVTIFLVDVRTLHVSLVWKSQIHIVSMELLRSSGALLVWGDTWIKFIEPRQPKKPLIHVVCSDGVVSDRHSQIHNFDQLGVGSSCCTDEFGDTIIIEALVLDPCLREWISKFFAIRKSEPNCNSELQSAIVALKHSNLVNLLSDDVFYFMLTFCYTFVSTSTFFWTVYE